MKVKNLIKNCLEVMNVAVLNTERKMSGRANSVCLVIASLQTVNVVKAVLSAKFKLKDSQQYENAFLHKDQSPEERSLKHENASKYSPGERL